MGLCNDLRFPLTVYGQEEITTEIGETDFVYSPLRTVWAGLTVTGGRTETLPGDTERAQVTHKITLRVGTVPELSTDMYFVCQGQKYEVQWWQPHYKKRDRIEVMCKLVVEDG